MDGVKDERKIDGYREENAEKQPKGNRARNRHESGWSERDRDGEKRDGEN